MKLWVMQPGFERDLPGDAVTILKQLKLAVQAPELVGLAETAGNCFEFKIEPADRRYWSPHLSVQISQAAAGAKLYGRFSPRPEVWTLIMAVYFAAALAMAVGLTFGYVHWQLGGSPIALLAVPAGLMVIVGLHAVSLIGQNRSADQMELLQSRLDRALEIALADATREAGPVRTT